MPMDRRKYAPDWEAISHRIRFERAAGKCEWCGAPHRAEIVRSDIDPAQYIVFDETYGGYRDSDGDMIRMSEIPSEYDLEKAVFVTLTTAHLNHDTMDNRDENLAALCNRCHLKYDAPYHAENARKTRAEKKRTAAADAGQHSMFE